MRKEENKERTIRLPMQMGPIEYWQGKCIPASYYTRLEDSDLTEEQTRILSEIRDFYQSYSSEEHLIRNKEAPTVLIYCEFPNYDNFQTVAFNLLALEKTARSEQKSVSDYLRVPKPTHWETEQLNLERNDEDESSSSLS